ncbi:MAG: hypothetical protein AAB336_08640 [Acidobacteriota bacterium]
MKTKIIFIAILFMAFATTAFAQDDNLMGKVVDAVSRKEIGKAEIVTTSDDFGFYVKMWLTGSKLRIIRPNSGSRSTTLNCSFREYKVNPNNPKDDSSWEEIGSGMATLQTPVDSNGNVSKMLGSMTLTEKIVNDKEVKVTEKAHRFEIIID